MHMPAFYERIDLRDCFQGHLKWFKLISNGMGYRPCPASDEEIEQHLRISADGQIWLSRYAFGDGSTHRCFSQKHWKINRERIARIVKAFEECFINYRSKTLVSDSGTWNMVVENTDGVRCEIVGFMVSDNEGEECYLSRVIRDELGILDLFAFDGDNAKDRVEHLEIDYHRISNARQHSVYGTTLSLIRSEYREKLILDRQAETIEHIQIFDGNRRIRKLYELHACLDYILCYFDNESFEDVQGEPENVVVDPNEWNEYHMTVDFLFAPRKTFTGHYGNESIPDAWSFIATRIAAAINYFGKSEILDFSLIYERRRRLDESVFLFVRLPKNRYDYYLTEDDSIQKGDKVWVPFGDPLQAERGIVQYKIYCTKEKAPKPLDETESIIRRCEIYEPEHW